MSGEGMSKKEAKERKRSLDRAVSRERVAGYRLLTETDGTAELVKKRHMNRIAYACLTIGSVGIWALVWRWFSVKGKREHVILTIDDHGYAQRSVA